MEVSEKEWEAKLTPAEYEVLRKKGTERPYTGEYDKFYPKEGYFACRACGNPLYTFQAKFDSGCGWPAFDKCIKGSIATHTDNSLFSTRTEIVCAKCGGHQGHVFEGEHLTDTNERHCVNSVSIKFVKGPLPEDAAKLGEEKVM
jgi:peptide-methionine (R)-S-oxide reductase